MFSKNLQYNLLSLINITISFVFIIFLGRKFGAGDSTDIYFLSITIVGYLGILAQCVWGAMSPYYTRLKVEDSQLAAKLYSVLLNNVILISLAEILLYFLVTNNFRVISPEKKEFLDVFIYYLVLQSIILFNKALLNLEKHFAVFYLVDIFITTINLIILLFFSKGDIVIIAYSTIIAAILAVIWQLYLVFFRLNYRYRLSISQKEMPSIYRNSIKMNIGLLLYGFKDIILVTVFTSFGSGVYSLFNYANKFSVALFQITNAPIVNIYVARLNEVVANKKFHEIKSLRRDVLVQTVLLLVIGFTVLYFILPYILGLFFKGKFSFEEIKEIQRIFSYMAVFYFVWAISIPYSRAISIFKLFNYNLLVNFIFFTLICSAYLAFKIYSLSYVDMLLLFSFAQFANLIFYFIKNKRFLNKKEESNALLVQR
ncbi:lipid II flippase MurJ [Methylobacter marinus]|uniref:lipid II flippase MurJ n=1 Tax=Methylobacter marinus TaxID=34058 RepID=UPI000366504B|nr:lipid II flippase MurJ [Methylobacter marinus]